MFRLWCARIGLVALVAAGTVAWGSLSLRGTNEWVFRAAKGRWFADIGDLSAREVGIVPGSMFRKGRPNPQLEERLWLALSLYESGRVGSLLVSGDEARSQETSGMRQWLIDRGVPASRIMADPMGVRTLATMTRAAQVFGVRSAIVCTQSWAAPRALFLARASGIDALALVPKTPFDPGTSGIMATENLKIALAFVERYLLGRAQPASAALATVATTDYAR